MEPFEDDTELIAALRALRPEPAPGLRRRARRARRRGLPAAARAPRLAARPRPRLARLRIRPRRLCSRRRRRAGRDRRRRRAGRRSEPTRTGPRSPGRTRALRGREPADPAIEAPRPQRRAPAPAEAAAPVSTQRGVQFEAVVPTTSRRAIGQRRRRGREPSRPGRPLRGASRATATSNARPRWCSAPSPPTVGERRRRGLRRRPRGRRDRPQLLGPRRRRRRRRRPLRAADPVRQARRRARRLLGDRRRSSPATRRPTTSPRRPSAAANSCATRGRGSTACWPSSPSADTDAERAASKPSCAAERRHTAQLRSRLSNLERRANLSRVSLRIETGERRRPATSRRRLGRRRRPRRRRPHPRASPPASPSSASRSSPRSP